MDMYAENIMHHFKEPHHYGKLSDEADGEKSKLISAKEANPLCGDKYSIQLLVDENGIIKDAAFTGEGCAISKASVSMLMDGIIGMDLKGALKIDKEKIFEMLGVEISAGRIKCALLGLEIIRKAINESNEKDSDK